MCDSQVGLNPLDIKVDTARASSHSTRSPKPSPASPMRRSKSVATMFFRKDEIPNSPSKDKSDDCGRRQSIPERATLAYFEKQKELAKTYKEKTSIMEEEIDFLVSTLGRVRLTNSELETEVYELKGRISVLNSQTCRVLDDNTLLKEKVNKYKSKYNRLKSYVHPSNSSSSLISLKSRSSGYNVPSHSEAAVSFSISPTGRPKSKSVPSTRRKQWQHAVLKCHLQQTRSAMELLRKDALRDASGMKNMFNDVKRKLDELNCICLLEKRKSELMVALSQRRVIEDLGLTEMYCVKRESQEGRSFENNSRNEKHGVVSVLFKGIIWGLPNKWKEQYLVASITRVSLTFFDVVKKNECGRILKRYSMEGAKVRSDGQNF